MSPERDIDLINDLRGQPSETTWLEFKSNLRDHDKIGCLISALSNAARLDGKESAFLVWGVEDATHNVIGTEFDPFTKTVGNQVFELWLRQQLSPAPVLKFRRVEHPNGTVVLLEIPAPTMAPTSFNGTAYIRVGSGTPKLTDDPYRYQALIEKMRPYTWEHGNAASYVTSDTVLEQIDYTSYFTLTKQALPDNRRHILEKLESDRLIKKDVGERWNILNLGAILFARDMANFDGSLARKAVRFVKYGGIDRTAPVTHRRDGQKGYAAGFEGLLSYINGLLPQNELIGQALRQAHPLFPQLSVRELTANALIHQDMTITGAGPLIELFNDRLEITNPGCPLVDTNRMIDLPPRSRNEAIASLMRRMGMCEEQGSGLDKVFREVEMFQLPAPLLKANNDSMQVVLYGPRTFADMTAEERVRACYFHAVLQSMAGERMRNTTLCERLGIDIKNAAQATAVIRKTMDAGLIKYADEDHPRAGYHPWWH